MGRRNIEDNKIRKIFNRGGSKAVTIPAEIINKLKIRVGQKVEFSLRGKTISIKDWKK